MRFIIRGYTPCLDLTLFLQISTYCSEWILTLKRCSLVPWIPRFETSIHQHRHTLKEIKLTDEVPLLRVQPSQVNEYWCLATLHAPDYLMSARSNGSIRPSDPQQFTLPEQLLPFTPPSFGVHNYQAQVEDRNAHPIQDVGEEELLAE
ncbi:hypothetical protein ASPVEDRAFT_686655 [Aspergillus versicolor CBS 583.65]|uniref:Uncharacterized protein n=1 Tax=Aspergillus versicolor CBS 583.65 TaxID=1036611 RepID=A0A1L9PMA3_ASPVE|nr:uncharacterized protein ASPVEDRAFT_686655 [Aspergillus versicolor CBS 583.65]OJJ02648.1 hypothetical protein ASPVEDRAFT_686655 [Aspergillus versicolor CBS 583.65]